MGTYNKFTEQEIQILRDNYSTMPKEELMALLPDRNWDGVLNYARKVLGLSREHLRSPKKEWSQDETNTMLVLLKDYSTEKVAQELGVSRRQLQTHLQEIGKSVTEIRETYWTEEEIQQILMHYQYAPQEYLLDKIPRKSWDQIDRYARYHYNLKRVAHDRVYVDYRFFDNWTEQSAYVLGFIMADGHITLNDDGQHNHNLLHISISRRDSDLMYKIATVLKFRGKILYPINRNKTGETEEIKICIHNRWLIEQAYEKGIPCVDKSHNATYPTDIPEEMQRHFIRGLIDGDGWVQFDNFQTTQACQIGFCGTQSMVTGVRDHFPIDCTDIQLVPNHSIYKIQIRGQRAFDLCKWLYDNATIYMDRKYDTFQLAKQKYE